jgi:hypothetical protein
MQSMKIATPLATVLALSLASLSATAVAHGTNSSRIDGVYRVTWTETEAIAAGAPYSSAHADLGFAHGHPVVIDITFRQGHFSLRDTSQRPPCTGTYTISGSTVSIHERPPACRGDIRASWSTQSGQLRLRVTKATDQGDAIIFGARPWTKIAERTEG